MIYVKYTKYNVDSNIRVYMEINRFQTCFNWYTALCICSRERTRNYYLAKW